MEKDYGVAYGQVCSAITIFEPGIDPTKYKEVQFALTTKHFEELTAEELMRHYFLPAVLAIKLEVCKKQSATISGVTAPQSINRAR